MKMEQQKEKEFISAEIEVIEFDEKDVIVTSGLETDEDFFLNTFNGAD